MLGFIEQAEELLINIQAQVLCHLQDFALKPFGGGYDLFVLDVGVLEVSDQFLDGHFFEHPLSFIKGQYLVLHRRFERLNHDRVSWT